MEESAAAEEADNTNIRMKSRAFYELCKCYIYTERYDDAEKCIEEMTHLFDDTEDKDYLITLNLWLSYDVLEMPEGTEKAVAIAKKIKDAIAKLKIAHEKSTVSDYITVSIGVSYADNEEVKECVLKRADQALYESKKTRDIIVAKTASHGERIL